MIDILSLLRGGFTITALDVDNALYMTSVLDENPSHQHRRILFWGLFAEFVGRLLLIYFFVKFLNGRDLHFSIFGIQLSLETISLVAAGLFLLIRNGRELIHILLKRNDETDSVILNTKSRFLPALILQATIVNLTLSIDTIIAIISAQNEAGWILYLLLFSAVFRYLFVRQIANIIHAYPSLNIIILAFLIIIGMSLILEGIGLDLNEIVVNVIILIAVGLAALNERRRPTISRWWQQQKKAKS